MDDGKRARQRAFEAVGVDSGEQDTRPKMENGEFGWNRAL